MGLPGDIGALVSAVTAGLSLMLNEIRRRSDASQETRGFRESLLRLEDRLSLWIEQAAMLNKQAGIWVYGLPESAGCRRTVLPLSSNGARDRFREL